MSKGPNAGERDIRILKRMEEIRIAHYPVSGGAYWGPSVLPVEQDEAALRREAVDQVDGEMMWGLFSPAQWVSTPSTAIMLAQLRYEQTWRFVFWCRLTRVRVRLRDIYNVTCGRAQVRRRSVNG